MTPPNTIPCPVCGMLLPWLWAEDGARSASTAAVCAGCGTALDVAVFPALHARLQRGRGGDKAVLDGEATCFNHSAAKAEAVCGECGRFLCALCDLEVGGRHLCPACLNAGAAPGGAAAERAGGLVQKRVCHARIALSLAVLALPLLSVCGAGIVSAAAAIAVAVAGLRSPGSLLGRQAGMLWFALLLSTLTLLCAAGFFLTAFFA